jgi:mRNA interferase RelE/StbE
MWAARRGAYRIVYEIQDDDRTIHVIRIDHRSDVYRPR